MFDSEISLGNLVDAAADAAATAAKKDDPELFRLTIIATCLLLVIYLIAGHFIEKYRVCISKQSFNLMSYRF